MRFGSTKPNAVRPTASPVKGQGVTGGPRPGPVNSTKVRPAAPNQMQFMSDRLRSASAQNAAKSKMGLGAAMANPKTTSATRTQSQMQDAANKQYAALRGTMGAAMGAGRALGVGKKKGGAVKKKATKK